MEKAAAQDTALENTKLNPDLVDLSKALLKKDNKLSDLDQRLVRLERRLKSNERFARTFAGCLSTQVLAIDAVTEIVRRSLREDAILHDELSEAIAAYDKRKVRRWFSGFLGVLFWLATVMLAAVVGAFIYWLFSGK